MERASPEHNRVWGREDDPDAAVEHLLNAAGQVFARKGVPATRMGDVAREAGCSRGTIYRYFPDREQLRRAYVDREARRVALRVAERLVAVESAHERLVAGIQAALAEVRADPVLAAWFDPASAGTAAGVASSATAIAGLVDAFLADLFERARSQNLLREGVDRKLAGDWVVRAILSLLALPADGSARAAARHERELLESFLVPALFDVPGAGRKGYRAPLPAPADQR